MSRTVRIDIVAPPFAGHLFPALGLVRDLIGDPRFELTCYSTGSGQAAISRAGIAGVELLAGHDAAVLGIANQSGRVASNPLRMIGQFRSQLRLMQVMIEELSERWSRRRPDLVVVDFAVPFAGLLAERMGLRWWTSMGAATAFETRQGPPGYLGGLSPGRSVFGRLRDWLGRSAVRRFKKTVAFVFRKELTALHVPRSIYRPDGTEILYSPEKVLVLGMRELEFERGWPEHVEFVGPISADPGRAGCEPHFDAGKRYCLISLGTHVAWAKNLAVKRFAEVAARRSDWCFDFSWGDPTREEIVENGNWRELSFVSYDRFLSRYDCVVHHAGIGVAYACLREGIGALTWPQDFDQFDHAARLIDRSLALRCPRRCGSIVKAMDRLEKDAVMREARERFKQLSGSYNAPKRFRELVEREVL